ncbi:MAG: outer membrane protein assembly factor BamA [Alphaproteobacteria bacterium]|nr:outer membrane protein assembly factor BamA [Alphaproteobacteria bacterium]MBT5389939.1 outer membrane protein assembly factor BamA [Alphaproteobacteria bacterium]MBT5540045.1 outer membrane protein assembly factor BamA [Alphaproteobacteria bacterium]MBT5654451.1 outer membrane protein assembly factor BamA [Alphaproteobacteria bacterium]
MKIKVSYRVIMGIMCSVIFSGSGVFSTLASAEAISQIVVEGNQRIEPETIASYMKLKRGDQYDEVRVEESLKSLYKTGLFTDVNIEQKGSVLVVKVLENPIINRIAFEGNQRVSDKILKAEVKLRPRMAFNRSKIQEEQQRLLHIYRLSGRFAATVEPKIIKLAENRVDLVFEINEGPQTTIRKIVFVGNKRFSDSRLESIIQTKESRWYRFFTSDDTYDPDRLAADQEILRRYYLKNGYADFRVKSAVAELSPNKEDFFITFTIDEGERYKFGKVGVNSKIPSLPSDDFTDALTMEEGDWYNSQELEKTIDNIMRIAGDQGYAFADPQPKVNRNKEEHTIDVTFDIEEGSKVFIGQIDIIGNTRTLDSVIRREFRLAEGDPFNQTKLLRSEQRIRNLGYFKKVSIYKEQGDAPDKVNIKVAVEEQSTGELNIAGGFSPQAGPLANFAIHERNLMGKGQRIGIDTVIAKRTKSVDLSFAEPYFLDRELEAGVNIYGRKDSFDRESSYEERTTGLTTWLKYHINEPLTQKLAYNINMDKISNLGDGTSEFIKEQPRRATTSAVSQTLAYDMRDFAIDPTSGYIVSLYNQFAGVGGTTRYSKNIVSGAYYIPLEEEVTLGLSAQSGIILGLGKTTRITDRFSLGGFLLRGFDFSGVGPRDRRGSQDALGGMKYYQSSAEVTFPIGLPNEFGIKGAAFVDAGSLWDAQKSNPNIFDDSSFRASTGLGLQWSSPFGPIRLDYGFPLKKRSLDKTRNLLFGFTSRF